MEKRRSRVLLIVGFIAMLAGALDPMEGSLVILLGTGLAALAALFGGSPYRVLLYGSFILTAVGVGALWGLSALGGCGGDSGRSMWWGVVILPYPVGWIMGLAGAIQGLRQRPIASGA